MSKANPKVGTYLSRAKQWRKEMEQLRKILLGCPLTEEFKWGKPCYTIDSKNLVLVIGFKNYCALLFVKGALLKDAKSILTRPSENTQAARQLRFTDVKQITKLAPAVKSYVREAIEAEKAGLKVRLKKPGEFAIPEEFQHKLDEMPALKNAFSALTPGRQRAYLLYFSAAKQAKTRTARVEKYIPQILKKKGLGD